MRYSLFVVLVLVLGLVAAESKKGLVVLDELQIKNTHSIFFKQLDDRGYDLKFVEATDPDLELTRYGEHLYDFLVLFAPETDGFGGNLDVDSILNFIDDGKNAIIVAGMETSDDVREIASECGVELGDDNTFVIDHLNFDKTDFDGDHTLIIADDFISAPVITGKKPGKVLYQGIDLLLEEDNDLLIPILRASPTAYSYSPDDAITDEPHVTGKSTVLIAALQARNNARVLISGSLDFFSDDFFNRELQLYGSSESPEAAGNEDVAENIVAWTIGERGLLRADNVQHVLEGGKTPDVYTVKQKLEFSIDIKEWDGSEWVAYKADDIQLEFVMLDPYVRVALDHNNKGRFSKVIHIPDVYGIYTLRVQYQRLGYATISTQTAVTVRPFRHNEFERFIVAAYPYYGSAFSMMAGLFVFGLVFLYTKDRKK